MDTATFHPAIKPCQGEKDRYAEPGKTIERWLVRLADHLHLVRKNEGVPLIRHLVYGMI